MKFAVIGTGGVGGYFGGKLAKNGEDVWFMARGKHLEAMRNNGLLIRSFEGDWIVPPGKMTGSPDDIGLVDVVLFCVKSYDTESAATQIAPLVSESTIIVSLQNGVDNEEKIQRIVPHGVVFGGVSYIYSTITSPGVVTHTVGPTKILFGELERQSESTTRKASQILDTMKKAEINATQSDDILSELWKKYVFIAAVGGMTALTRLTLGEILAVDASKEMLADAMRETDTIARAKGIHLPPEYVSKIFEILKHYDNSSRSSLYHDLINNRRLEIEAFSGTIVRYGGELGIETPVHRAIYSALLPCHLKHVNSPLSQ
ncbi:MAG: 2-dehydropantoate 2-reductase [Bacteroidetes bacterium]|nr:2-dehydropantoate 2-reductase [Bacteroidota bacterium]MCW5895877.1 2-dehydropantoate 2-reductase [Bacteroidota bacterium]